MLPMQDEQSGQRMQPAAQPSQAPQSGGAMQSQRPMKPHRWGSYGSQPASQGSSQMQNSQETQQRQMMKSGSSVGGSGSTTARWGGYGGAAPQQPAQGTALVNDVDTSKYSAPTAPPPVSAQMKNGLSAQYQPQPKPSPAMHGMVAAPPVNAAAKMGGYADAPPPQPAPSWASGISTSASPQAQYVRTPLVNDVAPASSYAPPPAPPPPSAGWNGGISAKSQGASQVNQASLNPQPVAAANLRAAPTPSAMPSYEVIDSKPPSQVQGLQAQQLQQNPDEAPSFFGIPRYGRTLAQY